MTGTHASPRMSPGQLLARITCWFFGHQVRRTGMGWFQCGRCDRVARTPVELP